MKNKEVPIKGQSCTYLRMYMYTLCEGSDLANQNDRKFAVIYRK